MKSLLADDKNKNIVVFINDFYPEFARAFTKLSERLGRPLRGIMLIDAERKASGKYLPDRDGFFEEIVVDFSDDAALRKAIKPLEQNLLLVGCESERSQLYFQRVIPHVPYVNTPTESSAHWSTNKGKMRELLTSYDPRISPQAVLTHDASEDTIKEILSKIHFPLIIKPTGLAASMLVNKVTNERELRDVLKSSFASLEEIYEHHRGLGQKTIVVEEFVEGRTYSIDAYVDASGNTYMLPFIHYENASMVGQDGYQIYRNETFTELSDDDIAEGQAVARKAIHAVGLRSSVAHIELFHTENSWKVIELGARPGGQRQDMYEVSYGIDHALNELLVKVGLEPDIFTELRTYSETFNLYAPKSGTVESLEGIDDVRRHPQLHSMDISVKPGDKVMPSNNGGTMLIDGLMHNSDREQLRRDTDAVRSTIKIKVK